MKFLIEMIITHPNFDLLKSYMLPNLNPLNLLVSNNFSHLKISKPFYPNYLPLTTDHN